jgi:hypothetical protein
VAAKRKPSKMLKIPTMINLTQEAARFLKEESKRTGLPMNVIVEDLLMGRHRFPPDLEERILPGVVRCGYLILLSLSER